MKRQEKGQSVLEYVIILTAIIAVIIVAATAVIRPAVNTAMTDAATSITNATSSLP
jgi:Flp pilus assembly pilin Flp